ncbi:MAG: hypothetical protein ACTTJC_00720 [Campylobacter sp.]
MIKFALCFLMAMALEASSSCYEIFDIKDTNEQKNAVFILVDETAKFDNTIKSQMLFNLEQLLEPNTYFYVAKFSAFIDGFYNQLVFDIKIEDKLSEDEEYHISKNKLAKLHKCLKDQKPYVRTKLISNVSKLISPKNTQIAKSEILNALKDYSAVVKRNKAKNKLVIIVSDMLENSAVTTFYAKGSLRKIDEIAQMQKARQAELIGDFGGAKIYVLGAGLIDNHSYKNSSVLRNFSNFWNEYFKASNANLIEFAMPTLKGAIEF